MSTPVSTIGDFLTYQEWENAIDILAKQLASMDLGSGGNRHFNTLSLFYYRNILKKSNGTYEDFRKDLLSKYGKIYFSKFVKNNYFYCLDSEFFAINYPVPKAGLGIRNYKFFSMPLRILYMAVGIYIVKLTLSHLDAPRTRDGKNSNSKIFGYYGGRFTIQEDVVVPSQIYYKRQYLLFSSNVLRHVKDLEYTDKVVLRLDIQNFFDELPTATLWTLLHDTLSKERRDTGKFNIATTQELQSFFEFIVSYGRGIPQSDNDIISSYIANLYLSFVDQRIRDIVQKHHDAVEYFQLIRYVDDVYLVIKLKKKYAHERTAVSLLYTIGREIADVFYLEFGLRVNDKTSRYWLNRQEDRKDLEKSIKKISLANTIPMDKGDQQLTKIETASVVDRILATVEQLRNRSNLVDRQFKIEVDDDGKDAFIYLYDPSVQLELRKPASIRKLEKLFSDETDFSFAHAMPLHMIVLFSVSASVMDSLKRYLLAMKLYTTRDADLAVKFLCQRGFVDEDSDIRKRLERSSIMKNIFNIFGKRTSLKCYGLNKEQIQWFCDRPLIIYQMRYRLLHERVGQYSIALNHLTNEIHQTCFEIEHGAGTFTRQAKQYKSTNVEKFLLSSGTDSAVITGIINLFNHRHHSGVSHAAVLPISDTEYYKYRSDVESCIRFLIQNL